MHSEMTHRKILGIVIWAQPKFGSVQPVMISSAVETTWETHLTQHDLAKEFFPNAGVISWINPPDEATPNSMWCFHVDEQPSYHDASHDPKRNFYVVRRRSEEQVHPVLDVDHFGGEKATRQLLTGPGVDLTGGPTRFWIRSDRTLWSLQELAPIEAESRTHRVSLRSSGLTQWTSWEPPTEPVNLTGNMNGLCFPSWIQFLPPNATPPKTITANKDWSDDKSVLKHLLKFRRDQSKRFETSIELTTRVVSEISDALTSGSASFDDPTLMQSRLDRVRDFIARLKSTDEIGEAAQIVIDESPIADEVKKQKAKIIKDAKAQAKATAEAELKRHREAHEGLLAEIKTKQDFVEELDEEIAKLRESQEQQVLDLETDLATRVSQAMDSPRELLASVALIRAVGLPTSRSARLIEVPESSTDCDSPTKKLADSQAALTAFKTGLTIRDTPARVADAVLPGVLSGLVPVATGTRRSELLAALADTLCGARAIWLPVSPAWIDTADLFRFTERGNQQSELTGALARARANCDLLYLVVFEGLERSPPDFWLTPLLACYRDAVLCARPARMVPGDGGPWPANLLVATTVSGFDSFSADGIWSGAFPVLCDEIDYGQEAAIFENRTHPRRHG